MATMVIVVDGKPGAGALDAAAAAELAELGVTSISVVRDDAGVGLVLEGWAFDPFVSGERAAAIVAGAGAGVRVLQPLLQTAVSSEGRIR